MFESKADRSSGSWFTGETLCLAAPLLLLPFLFWELSLASPLPYYTTFILANIGDGILGSVGHSGLAWGLVFLTPEGRMWWGSEESRLQRLKVISIGVAAFCITLGIFMLDDVRYTTWLLTIYICLTLHHSIAQTQGLAFAYSFAEDLDPASRMKVERLHRQQKIAFKLLILLACYLPVDGLLGIELLQSSLGRMIYIGCGSLIAGWIVFSNRQLAGSQRNKMIFLARNFSVPLGAVSVFAAHSIRIFHSIEYILLYRKMLSYSRVSEIFKTHTAGLISIALYLGFSGFWIFFFFTATELRTDYEFATGMPWWFRVLAAMTVTRSLMHYYMDRIIFRMSNPISRKWWGPMLIGRERSYVQSQ